MNHPEMRNTVFGEVLAELLEERDLPVTPFKVGKLAEECGLDGWAFISRMANTSVGNVGYLDELARRLNLSEPEKMELSLAYALEARVGSPAWSGASRRQLETPGRGTLRGSSGPQLYRARRLP